MRRSFISGAAVLGFGLLAWASPADALVVWGQNMPGNDCSGVFGTGFDNCVAFGSPSIIKFESGPLGITTEINSLFPSIDGSEFDFIPALDGSLTSGSWIYTPGPGDPQIKYWAVKGGPNLRGRGDRKGSLSLGEGEGEVRVG